MSRIRIRAKLKTPWLDYQNNKNNMSNFNDFLGVQAAKLNMTREEYTAYYLSEAKPGPKPYHRGLDDNEIEDKKDQIKKQSDMADDDSSAYKEMPGDKEAREKGEVKTSKHVKKYHELYGDKKDESVDEATFRPNSGTMSGGTYNLDNRKYELKKDVEGVQIGNYTNIVLPKGTIIYNIPGGVFADHSSLKRYENRSNKYFNKSTFKGISIIRKKETIFSIDKNSKILESLVNEEKIKYAKGKTYQSSGHWTVVVDSNSSGLDIRVNHSAGWRLDPHDEKEETFELLDNGRQRATLYFKSGNIDKFAKQMFDLNDRTTHGNKTKLTAKDYADIIRVWIDMRKANEGNYNLEDIYDLISHHRFNKDYEKLSSKDKEWIQNDAEERGFVESLSPRFFNSLLKTLNEDLITESRVPNFKFGKKLQYNADDINQMYGFWGTLDVHMDSYEIEEIWNDVWGILTKGWKFSDAGALYYLNAKAGRWLADKVWNDINSQISQPDAIDMILSDYARPSKWKAWAKEYNEFAQEELAECVILEKAEGDRGPISDPKIEKALKTKSEETGVPIGIIRIIMRRGMAAWKTGHRPGATEQQWGYARVNAFLTKGKGTWGDADKDVAKEVRDEGHDKELKEQNHFDQSHRNNNI